MSEDLEKLFFEIIPAFPISKKWTLIARDKTGTTREVIILEDKESLLSVLDQAIPDDENTIDANFEEN
ncbi:hypothetical protein LCGC14_1422960 [marine sediment metagenome]|uniref:Uncharacterized protein n=1 Tax=marine sediment metagenome TaxID=412755 RepID=A0A0F9JQL9_9ZZZZ